MSEKKQKIKYIFGFDIPDNRVGEIRLEFCTVSPQDKVETTARREILMHLNKLEVRGVIDERDVNRYSNYIRNGIIKTELLTKE